MCSVCYHERSAQGEEILSTAYNDQGYEPFLSSPACGWWHTPGRPRLDVILCRSLVGLEEGHVMAAMHWRLAHECVPQGG